jgi:hypothetical protein
MRLTTGSAGLPATATPVVAAPHRDLAYFGGHAAHARKLWTAAHLHGDMHQLSGGHLRPRRRQCRRRVCGEAYKVPRVGEAQQLGN